MRSLKIIHFLKQKIIQRWSVGPKLWVCSLVLSILFIAVIIIPTFLSLSLKSFLPTLIIRLVIFYLLLNGLLVFIIQPQKQQVNYKGNLLSVLNLNYFFLCFGWLIVVEACLGRTISLIQFLSLFMVLFLFKIILNYIYQDLKYGWQTRLWML